MHFEFSIKTFLSAENSTAWVFKLWNHTSMRKTTVATNLYIHRMKIIFYGLVGVASMRLTLAVSTVWVKGKHVNLVLPTEHCNQKGCLNFFYRLWIIFWGKLESQGEPTGMKKIIISSLWPPSYKLQILEWEQNRNFNSISCQEGKFSLQLNLHFTCTLYLMQCHCLPNYCYISTKLLYHTYTTFDTPLASAKIYLCKPKAYLCQP